MKYSSLSFKNQNTLKYDSFKGVVTSSNKDAVAPGRLIDGKNVWNNSSVISSRPGIALTENGIINPAYSMADITKVFYAEFPFESIPGYNRLCAIVKETPFERTEIDYFVVDSLGKSHHLFYTEMVGGNGAMYFEVKNIHFVKDKPLKGCGIFILIPIKETDGLSGLESKTVRYYELSKTFDSLIITNPSSFYRPLISKNKYGNAIVTDVRKGRPTSYPEGVNILGGNFEACYTTDGHSHSFEIPTTIAEDAEVEIRVYTSKTTYLKFVIPPFMWQSQEILFAEKYVKVKVSREAKEFFFTADDELFEVPRLTPENNLRLFSRSDTSLQAYELLSRNAIPVRFDGRNFIPGGENRGNKIYFSGKDRPLYYSERNSISVGDTNYDLTALSLQSRYIIAFKEREMYRLSLSESKELDRDTLLEDNTLLEIPVPTCVTTRINDGIGCDLPNTIVNCTNRLVWFHSNGKVYTLYGSNQYTEGSIFELSEEISDQLSNLNSFELTHAFGAELSGYYVLGTPSHLFLMDTKTGGFRYLLGHKPASKSYGGLPWFIWNAPDGANFASAFTCGKKDYFLMYTEHEKIYYIASTVGEKDIIPTTDGGTKESLPEFSFSTPLMGNTSYLNKISVAAQPKHSITIEAFDENGTFKTADIKGGERLRSFVLPLSYKKGKTGITIKGRGNFYLKEILVTTAEKG